MAIINQLNIIFFLNIHLKLYFFDNFILLFKIFFNLFREVLKVFL